MVTNADKIDFMVVMISLFAKKFGLSTEDAYRYLSKYKALELCEKHYGIMHTLPFDDDVDDLARYCRRQGGDL